MNRTTWIRLLLVGVLGVFGTTLAVAAKPAIELPQATPIITASATPFNASYVAANVLDQNSLTEYASQGQGVNTFIDFDFGSPTPITHFHHLNRSAADGITSSELIFSDDPTFATGTTVVPIAHASQTAAINYAVGSQVARYVRWDVTGISGAATNQGAREIAFLNLTGAYAQIADPAITASAPQFNASFPASNVFDNNPATDYASAGQGAATFIDFDFGAVKRISGFELDNRSGHPLDAILGSSLSFSNDPTFTTGVTTVPLTHTTQEGPLVYGVGDHFARYVRWDVTNVQPGGAAGNQGAAEIGFYAEVSTSHFALSSPTVTSSSTPYNASFVAENMFDGNLATEFASQSIGVGTFVEMDFGATYLFAGVEHLDRGAFVDWITGAKLTFSEDATFDASDPVVMYDQLSAAYETFGLTPARYVRWEVTGVTPGNFNNVGGKELVFYAAVPEPGSLLLSAVGLVGLVAIARRRRRHR